MDYLLPLYNNTERYDLTQDEVNDIFNVVDRIYDFHEQKLAPALERVLEVYQQNSTLRLALGPALINPMSHTQPCCLLVQK